MPRTRAEINHLWKVVTNNILLLDARCPRKNHKKIRKINSEVFTVMKHIAKRRGLLNALALTALLPISASAQSEGEDYLKLLGSLASIASPPDHTSIQGVASASIAPVGYVFAGVSGTTNDTDGGVNGIDGSITIGAGLGNFGDVETQATVNITSVHPSDFADSGSFGFKFGTTLETSDKPIKVSLSFDNLGGWGDSSDDIVTTTLAASSSATRYTANGTSSYAWTLGVKSISGDSPSAGTSGFAGLSLGLSETFSVSTAYDTRSEAIKLGTSIKVNDVTSVALTANDPFDMGEAQGITLTVSFASKLF